MASVTPFDIQEMELVFPRFKGEARMTESEICIACHGCCNYVTVPIAYPRSKDKLDQYVWYLLHRNVEIEIDNYRKWFLIFKTPCDKLGADGACGVYETRPEICRDYSSTACSRVAKDHLFRFQKPEEMLVYLNSRKKKSRRRRAP